MSDGPKYKIAITAIGEVRDKDGNLLSSTPVEFDEQVVTEDMARSMGLLDDQGDKE